MQAEGFYEAAFTETGEAVEADVAIDFDTLMDSLSRWFLVEREVTGWYLSQRCRVPAQRPRIDRILRPKRELLRAGWSIGPVGVELKRQGAKIGPAISQALDYGHAAFPFGDVGSTVCLEWIFIWPVGSVTGDLASVMAQNRIGWACTDWRGDFNLRSGGMNVLTANANHATFKKPTCGYKVGSR